MGKDNLKKPLTAASKLRQWLKEADPIDIANDIYAANEVMGLNNPIKEKNQFYLGELLGIMYTFKKGKK